MRTSIVKELGGPTNSVTLLASALRTASGTGATVISGDLSRAQTIAFECSVSAITAGTSLDVEIQASLDGGSTWFELAQLSQYATTAGVKIVKVRSPEAFATEVAPVADPAVAGTAAVANNFAWCSHFRAKWTLVGTNYTFAVVAYPFYST